MGSVCLWEVFVCGKLKHMWQFVLACATEGLAIDGGGSHFVPVDLLDALPNIR